MHENSPGQKKTINTKNRNYGTGLRLKQIRQALKYTNERMGALLGLTRSGYYKCETGKGFPSPYALEALSTKLRISMDWLLFERGPVYRAEDEPAKEPTAKTGGKGQLLADNADVHEMLTAMADIPLIKHELLAHFQRLKVKNKGLFAPHTG
ncbi:MAG: helix-turn-helix domain-containing protein [bacterium]|nr:helix-turn-helix domain-containing protein [bacterium]